MKDTICVRIFSAVISSVLLWNSNAPRITPLCFEFRNVPKYKSPLSTPVENREIILGGPRFSDFDKIFYPAAEVFQLGRISNVSPPPRLPATPWRSNQFHLGICLSSGGTRSILICREIRPIRRSHRHRARLVWLWSAMTLTRRRRASTLLTSKKARLEGRRPWYHRISVFSR